jgi:3-phenylpropionate/cinnamic acid dioxygenase small subunit
VAAADGGGGVSPEEFLYLEATLLDERRYEEWLELYADDAVYWVPQGEATDPVHHVSIAYDDRRRLRERVLRLQSGFAYSQDPPSRTCHLVGNVRVLSGAGEPLGVASNLIVTEFRRERQNIYAAHVEHLLVREQEGYRISRKTIRLVNSEMALGNLTFLI